MAYSIDVNGNKKFYSTYSRLGVPTLTRLFPNDPENTKKLLKKSKTARTGRLQDLYNTKDNSGLVRKIFYVFLLKIIKRVANGDLFLFPGKTNANITLKYIPSDEVKKLRQMGKFMNIDIIKSRFQIPRFTFDFGPKSNKKDMQIYVGPELHQTALKNAENGSLALITLKKES